MATQETNLDSLKNGVLIFLVIQKNSTIKILSKNLEERL